MQWPLIGDTYEVSLPWGVPLEISIATCIVSQRYEHTECLVLDQTIIHNQTTSVLR
jgi:hypothetical protein